MKSFLKILKNKDNLFIILILLFAFLLRIVLLDKFPIGITHDELNNIFAAKSIFWTGSFAPGTAPAVLPSAMSNFTVTVPEVPAFLSALFIGPLPLSMFTGRFLGAILSVLSILAVYLIVQSLFKNKSISRIVIILLAINPWSFLLGRTMAELNFFVALYLWGFYILINSKGWNIFRALPFYILGFFSYTGGQISFFVFMVITLIYHYFTSQGKNRNLKVYLIFMGFISLVFAGYLFIATQNQSFAARGKELYLPTLSEISDKVNEYRRLAIPTPLNNLFINKATVYVGGFLQKYLNTFSVDYLFLKGEARAIFSYQTHGTFYLVDFLFIIIGLSSLYALNKRFWFFTLAVVIGCSVTSGLSLIESSYSQRVGLIYPFLVITIGVGIFSTLQIISSKIGKKIFATAVIGIYIFSFFNLMHIYFIRFPVYASDGWFFQDRVLSSYLNRVDMKSANTKIIVYTVEPKIIFEEYLFYTKKYEGNNIQTINNKLDKKDYSEGNIKFTDVCPESISTENTITIFDERMRCFSLSNLSPLIRIDRLKDVYSNYLIYADKLCDSGSFSRYISPYSFLNFSAEKFTDEVFCRNWITVRED